MLDNFSTGNRANLEGLGVEVVEGELRSYERVHNAVRGTEVVYHLGALGSVPRSVQDPLTSSAVNVEGTLNVLLAARDEGVRRVVYTSSSSVYGSSAALPAHEDAAPDPLSPYGVAKLAAERYCISFSRVYERFESVVVRYFNVFGPRQSPFSQYAAVVPLFITAIANGRPVTIEGDGEQRRDFTYVENVVDGTLKAGDTAGVSGRIFNLAASAPASVNELADADRDDRRPARRADDRPAARGRHQELLGRHLGRTGDAGLRALGRSRGRPPPHRRGDRPAPTGLVLATRRAPIRVLRAIARLNMGGPALHVSYLSAGLRERGYETILVAGSVGQGEQSMAYVAEELGVPVVTIPHLHREISPVRDLLATVRLARIIRAERPAILHTHTAKAGAVGRVAALLAGRRRPPIIVHTFHGHVLRGYFGRFWTGVFRLLERWLARITDALVAVSPEVRDELVAFGVAPASKFRVIRLGIELDERLDRDGAARAETRRVMGIARRAVRGGLDRPDDGREADRHRPQVVPPR